MMTEPKDLRIVADTAAGFSRGRRGFRAPAECRYRSTRPLYGCSVGGSTPKSLFNLLASQCPRPLPWDQIFFFWGDERHVPPDSPESNYRMANEALLSKVPVPAGISFAFQPRILTRSRCRGIATNGLLRKFFQQLQELSRVLI